MLRDEFEYCATSSNGCVIGSDVTRLVRMLRDEFEWLRDEFEWLRDEFECCATNSNVARTNSNVARTNSNVARRVQNVARRVRMLRGVRRSRNVAPRVSEGNGSSE